MAISDSKVVAMPDREEMRRRLEAVLEDDYLRERFIPLLLKSAGRELVGSGVVTMIQIAIYDFASDIPMMGAVMQDFVKPIVAALVDDEEVKAEALAFADTIDAKLKKMES